MRLRPSIPLLTVLLLPAGPGRAAPAPAPTKEAAPQKPALLRDDPLLQQEITLGATGRPLGEVLALLSPRLKVDLTVSPGIADQRVTLHLTDQPLYLLLNRLTALLSHAPDRPRGSYWEKQRPASGRAAFNLWRDLRSAQDEDYERDYPRREAARMLRDLRNMAQMPGPERAKYKGDYPDQLDDYSDGPPFVKAMRGLTDDQLDALAAGQSLLLDPTVFADEVAAQQREAADAQKFLAGILAERKKALAAGQPDPHSNMRLPYEAPPAVPVLRLTRSDLDEDVGWSGMSLLSIEGISHISPLILDAYNTTSDPALYRAPPVYKPAHPQEDQGPVVDLTPLLGARAATPAQRADIGFTLQALAQAAHLNVYQEDFLRKSLMDSNRDLNAPAPDSVGLKTLKGTAPALIAAICAHWDYRWQRTGGDYLFWSRTWALDRADDVPERFIAPWRRRLKAQGAFTLADRAEFASRFPLRLIRLTLDQALPEAGPWPLASYHLLRLLGRLPAADREAALSGGGLALGSASPQGKEAIADDYRDSLKDVPDDQRARVVMTLRLGDGPKAPARPVVLVFTLDRPTVLDVRQDLRGPQTPAPSAPRP